MTNPLTCTNVSASDVLVLIVSQYCIKSRMYPVKSWGDADFENQKSSSFLKYSVPTVLCRNTVRAFERCNQRTVFNFKFQISAVVVDNLFQYQHSKNISGGVQEVTHRLSVH